MRIIAGTAKGRRLHTPKSADTIRPTSDRVRESLFNILGQWLTDLDVLDLYAGTGAFGLEALSRGARSAVLVDSGTEALELCRMNAEATGLAPTLNRRRVEEALNDLARAGAQFDVIFSDPPYALQVADKTVERVAALTLLRPGGTLIVEHDRREAVADSVLSLFCDDRRHFGDTTVSFYRYP